MTPRRIFLATLIPVTMLAACDDARWVPDTFPAVVELQATLSPEQKVATLDAADRWNQAVGVAVFEVVETDRKSPTPGRVRVSKHKPEGTSLAATWEMPRWALVYLGDCADPIAIAHELGHVLDLRHDEHSVSVMREHAHPDGVVLAEHVAHVRALMGLTVEVSP